MIKGSGERTPELFLFVQSLQGGSRVSPGRKPGEKGRQFKSGDNRAFYFGDCPLI